MSREHINEARIAATVQLPEIIEAVVRAEYTSGDLCICHLQDALEHAEEIVGKLKAAVTAEADLHAKEKEALTAARGAPRTPNEAITRLTDFVMFGTPMFGEPR